MTKSPAIVELTATPWLRSYALLVQWELLSLRLNLAVIVAIQILVGAGAVVGFGFFFDEVPAEQALYLSTGASVVALLMVGLAMTPQAVSQNRADGTWDFQWSLPVPRSALLGAAITVWSCAAVPGMVAALAVANLRYDIDIAIGPALVPAVALILAMSISLGYAVGIVSRGPRGAAIVSQIMFVSLLMFTPINFPADRFPSWLAELHRYLPFQAAADLVRGGVSDATVDGAPRSFLVLAGWTGVALVVSMAALRRRR